MSRRSLIGGVATSSLIAAAHAQHAPTPVKVGVLTDMGGIFSDNSGVGMVTAVQMAIEDSGGSVANRPVQLVVADHRNKPDIAVGIARDWIDAQGVDVIVDVIGSATALAVQALTAEKGCAMLNVGSGGSDLTGKACTPVAVQWVWDTYAFGSILGQAMIDAGRTSFFFISADYTYGEQMQRDTTRAILAGGGTVVGSVKHAFGLTDFSSAMLQASSSGARVIVLANAGADTSNAVKSAVEFQVTKDGKQALAALVGIREIHALGLPTAQGIVTPSAFYWDLDDATRAFAARFTKRVNFMVGELQAGGYSAVLHYLKAVATCGTTEARTVVRTMKASPVSDMFARNAKLREDGRLVHDLYLARVKSPAESHGEWDEMAILKTYPGDQMFRPLTDGGCPLVAKI